MNKHTLQESAALVAEAYNPVQSCPAGVEQTFYSAPNGVQFFIRVAKDTAWVVFRGSNSPLDWAHNMAFNQMEAPVFCKQEGVKVHRGFLWGYTSDRVRGQIHARVGPCARVRITGHSYGAALATLCALDIRLSFPHTEVEAHLFGSPRVGNRAFMRCYNWHVIRTVRVECGNDVVTKVPFAIMGYRHVGSRLHVGRPRLPLVYSAEDHYPYRYYQGLLRKLLP